MSDPVTSPADKNADIEKIRLDRAGKPQGTEPLDG
jgi:hypothetical protein